MNYLRSKLNAHRKFYQVIALAIAVNLVLAGVFAFLQISIKDITVTVNDRTAKYRTMKPTVDKLLESWNVSLDKRDVVEPGKAANLKEGMDVKIKLFEEKTERVMEDTAFKTKKSYSSEYLEGQRKVIKKGVKGQDRVTYRVTYLGGIEQKRKEISRQTVKKPITKEVAIGTAVAYKGVKYSRQLTVVATGYTHTGNRTATGTNPHRGTIAVDRSVIPMGSRGYVPGYGEVHAEDTGGAIRGNRIDLFFESRGQAVSWGRRTVTLYLK